MSTQRRIIACLDINHVLNTFCVQYILTKIASLLDRDEVKINKMLVNMKTNSFPLIATIIFPRVLTLCYPVHLENWLSFVEMFVRH